MTCYVCHASSITSYATSFTVQTQLRHEAACQRLSAAALGPTEPVLLRPMHGEDACWGRLYNSFHGGLTSEHTVPFHKLLVLIFEIKKNY